MSNIKSKIKDTLGGEKFSASTMTALVLAVVAVVNVLLYTLVEFFGLYLYKPESDDLTISGATDALFTSAMEDGKKVTIYFCYSEDEVKNHDTGGYVYQTAKYFEERYPEFIELDYVNIITRRNKNGEIVSLSKYQTDMHGNETPIYASSVIFECGNNYRVVTDTATSAGYAPFFTLNSDGEVTSYNGEEVIAGMISWVLTSEHRNAYFTQYHGETADVAFSNLLACAGYYVNVIDLRKEEVPEDADLVVISNPTSDFEAAREGSGLRAEIDRLRTYVARGGNLYVELDPYVKALPVLEKFISDCGISFSATETESGKKIRNMIKDSRNAITTDGFTLVTNFSDDEMSQRISANVSKYSDGSVMVREASALELSGNAKPLLITSSAAVLEAGGDTVSAEGPFCVAAYSEVKTEDKVARVFVVPSIYLAVSDSLVTDGYANKDFIYSLLDEFFGAENLPYGCNAVLYDTQTLENLKMGTAKLYTALILLVPVAIAAVGTVVIVRRKSR